jgi:hypothetical protein
MVTWFCPLYCPGDMCWALTCATMVTSEIPCYCDNSCGDCTIDCSAFCLSPCGQCLWASMLPVRCLIGLPAFVLGGIIDVICAPIIIVGRLKCTKVCCGISWGIYPAQDNTGDRPISDSCTVAVAYQNECCGYGQQYLTEVEEVRVNRRCCYVLCCTTLENMKGKYVLIDRFKCCETPADQLSRWYRYSSQGKWVVENTTQAMTRN